MVIFHSYVSLPEGNNNLGFTLWYINIDPGSHRGWKSSFHEKLVIFRVYVYLPEGKVPFSYWCLVGNGWVAGGCWDDYY